MSDAYTVKRYSRAQFGERLVRELLDLDDCSPTQWGGGGGRGQQERTTNTHTNTIPHTRIHTSLQLYRLCSLCRCDNTEAVPSLCLSSSSCFLWYCKYSLPAHYTIENHEPWDSSHASTTTFNHTDLLRICQQELFHKQRQRNRDEFTLKWCQLQVLTRSYRYEPESPAWVIKHVLVRLSKATCSSIFTLCKNTCDPVTKA